MTAPTIISHKPFFFDVCCDHDPPGTAPGDRPSGIRAQAWVKEIPAYTPDQAAKKAIKFLSEQRGAKNIEVKSWRYSRKEASQ